MSPDIAGTARKPLNGRIGFAKHLRGCVLLSSEHRNYNLNKHQLTPQAVHATGCAHRMAMGAEMHSQEANPKYIMQT